MTACPCCLTPARPGRSLACAACGDEVCASCLHRDPARGRLCGSCLWEACVARGTEPPIPEPAGRRRRAAQAACPHAQVVPWMGHCPSCGDTVHWEAEHDNPVCDACGAPSHDGFNACWSCGESFGQHHAPLEEAQGYALEHPCDCGGSLAWLMPFCPWCAAPQAWAPSQDADAPTCLSCEAQLDPTWAFCVACGEEAPLPEDCFTCGGPLESAEAAARCEHCRRWVCDGCFGDYQLASAREGEAREVLLCGACAETLDATPIAEEEEAGEASAPPPPPPREAAPAPEPPPPPAAASPWEVLGVAPGTPLAEVKRAYHALVAQYHPDKVAALGPKLQALALEETRRLNEAFAELRERAQRAS